MELRIQLAKHTLLSTDPVLFDAIYVIGGNKVDESMKSAKILIFLRTLYMGCAIIMTGYEM